MDPLQIIIAICLIIITGTIVTISVFLIRLIQDVQGVVGRGNELIDSVQKPIDSVSNFVDGFKNGFSFFKFFRRRD